MSFKSKESKESKVSKVKNIPKISSALNNMPYSDVRRDNPYWLYSQKINEKNLNNVLKNIEKNSRFSPKPPSSKNTRREEKNPKNIFLKSKAGKRTRKNRKTNRKNKK